MKKYLLLLCSLIIANVLYSQTQYRELVYLKNGSVIKGIIIEQIPNESLKIETSDGSIYVYPMSDVEKITKEPILNKKGKNFSSTIKPQKDRKGYLGFSLGVAVPTSSYRNDADVEVGVHVNLAEYGHVWGDHFGMCAKLYVGVNNVSSSNYYYYDDSWSYSGILVGPLFSFSLTNKIKLDLKPMLGFASITSPLDDDYENVAFDFGAQLRFNLGSRTSVMLGLEYFYTQFDTSGDYYYDYINDTYHRPSADSYDISNLALTVGFGFRL